VSGLTTSTNSHRGNANRQSVNELSNSIDLESTLIRAEALFRRFERTVEAIDRKNTFPAPSGVRQRRPGPGSPRGSADLTNAVPVTITGASPASQSVAGRPASSSAQAAQPSSNEPSAAEAEIRVITPELRALLSRIPPKLDKGEVTQHGGGVGS